MVNLRNLEAAEVARTVGSEGRVNEAKDRSGALKTLLGGINQVATNFARNQAAAQQEVIDTTAGEFQADLINDQVTLQEQELLGSMSQEDADFLKSGADVQLKFQRAIKAGRADAFLRLRQSRMQLKMLNERPDLVDEINSVFSKTQTQLDKIDSELDAATAGRDEAVQERAKAISNSLIKFGLARPSDIQGMNPTQIEAAYVNSPLFEVEREQAEGNILANIADTSGRVSAHKKRLARENDIRKNGAKQLSAAAASVNKHISNFRANPDGGVDAYRQRITDARTWLTQHFIDTGRADDAADAEARYSHLYDLYDEAMTVDPLGEEANMLENKTNILIQEGIYNKLVNDPRKLDMRAELESMGSIIHSPAGEPFINNGIARFMLDRTQNPGVKLDGRYIQDQVQDDPESWTSSFVNMFRNVKRSEDATPEAKIAGVSTIATFLSQDYPEAGITDQMLTKMGGELNDPSLVPLWREYVEISPTYQGEMQAMQSKAAGFLLDNVSAAGMENLSFADGKVKAKDPKFAPWAKNVNNYLYGLAYMRGIENPTQNDLREILVSLDGS